MKGGGGGRWMVRDPLSEKPHTNALSHLSAQLPIFTPPSPPIAFLSPWKSSGQTPSRQAGPPAGGGVGSWGWSCTFDQSPGPGFPLKVEGAPGFRSVDGQGARLSPRPRNPECGPAPKHRYKAIVPLIYSHMSLVR